MDERTDIINKVRAYQSLVKQSDFPMKIENVYLFGSHAKGNFHKDSDIDVAFVVNTWQGDFFEVIPPIWRLSEQVDFPANVCHRDADIGAVLVTNHPDIPIGKKPGISIRPFLKAKTAANGDRPRHCAGNMGRKSARRVRVTTAFGSGSHRATHINQSAPIRGTSYHEI